MLPVLLLIDHPTSWVLGAACVTGMPIALICLASEKNSRPRFLTFSLALLGTVMFGAIATLVGLRLLAPDQVLFGPTMMTLLLGVWLIPYLVVGITYAFLFRRQFPDEATLDHLRKKYSHPTARQRVIGDPPDDCP